MLKFFGGGSRIRVACTYLPLRQFKNQGSIYVCTVLSSVLNSYIQYRWVCLAKGQVRTSSVQYTLYIHAYQSTKCITIKPIQHKIFDVLRNKNIQSILVVGSSTMGIQTNKQPALSHRCATFGRSLSVSDPKITAPFCSFFCDASSDRFHHHGARGRNVLRAFKFT